MHDAGWAIHSLLPESVVEKHTAVSDMSHTTRVSKELVFSTKQNMKVYFAMQWKFTWLGPLRHTLCFN